MSNVLLTFTGFHDPYSKGLVGQEEQRGPILSLVAAQAFDRVILLSTPATEAITAQTECELRKLSSGLEVESRDVPLAGVEVRDEWHVVDGRPGRDVVRDPLPVIGSGCVTRVPVVAHPETVRPLVILVVA